MKISLETYSAWSNNSSIRALSSSGGLYSEIAKHLLEQGYAVVGARYREDCTVEHDIITEVGEIELLRGTKYVASDMSSIREKMRKINKKICFFGTPCQTASVKADVKIDLVCRGIIPRTTYLAYLRELESFYESKVSKVEFKCKDFGWNFSHIKISFENGDVYLEKASKDPYIQGFVKHNILMNSCCFQCKFRGENRFSDITIGDFWGYKDPLGVSLAIVRTEQGKRIFDSLNIHKKLESYKKALGHNRCLEESPKEHPKRKEFLELLKTKSFTDAYEECIR
jgi:coenzyme F420-reducing hydrogenase beta subunit